MRSQPDTTNRQRRSTNGSSTPKISNRLLPIRWSRRNLESKKLITKLWEGHPEHSELREHRIHSKCLISMPSDHQTIIPLFDFCGISSGFKCEKQKTKGQPIKWWSTPRFLGPGFHFPLTSSLLTTSHAKMPPSAQTVSHHDILFFFLYYFAYVFHDQSTSPKTSLPRAPKPTPHCLYNACLPCNSHARLIQKPN